MNISLRKASALSKSLLEMARALPLTKQVVVSAYATAPVADEVATAQEKLRTNTAKAYALIKAAFEIRTAIGAVNSTSGVDALLSEKASIDTTEKLVSTVVSITPAHYGEEDEDNSSIVAQARLDAMRVRLANPTETRYGGNNESVTVNIVNNDLATNFQSFLGDLRRRKIAIADELLVLNMQNTITVSEDTAALLAEYKLV
jgi:hypothetical protein